MKKILLLFWVALIVYFSNTTELQVSNPKTWINGANYEEKVNLKDLTDKDSYFYLLYDKHINKEFILHKIGHIVAYSLLTFLLYTNLKKIKNRAVIVWILVVIFAFTDEIHQYFVVGRSGRVIDVILDSTVSLITVVLMAKKNK